MAMKGFARFGKRKASRRAVDQAYPKLGLQRSDAAAEFRCLEAESLSCGGVRAKVRDFGKEVEIVEISNRGHVTARIVLSGANIYCRFGVCPRGLLQRYDSTRTKWRDWTRLATVEAFAENGG